MTILSIPFQVQKLNFKIFILLIVIVNSRFIIKAKQSSRMSQQQNKEQFHEKMEIQRDNGQSDQNRRQVVEQNNVEEEQIQYQELNQQQYQRYAEQVEINSKRAINKAMQQIDLDDKDQQQKIQPMKNPVSAYLIFTMRWKTENPDKKFSMSNLGQLWKNLGPQQKRQYEDEYRKQKQKYDLYIASKLIQNPNAEKQQDVQNKFFFPLHRIRAIMKQDKFYSPKTEAVTAMAKATQYFGEYFLEELKKITQGKGRIDTKDLFQCISVNQRVFGFLDCLIDDYTEAGKQKKTQKTNIQEDSFKEKPSPIKQKREKDHQNSEIKQRGRPANQTSATKPLPKGQMNLMNMFGKK